MQNARLRLRKRKQLLLKRRQDWSENVQTLTRSYLRRLQGEEESDASLRGCSLLDVLGAFEDDILSNALTCTDDYIEEGSQQQKN